MSFRTNPDRILDSIDRARSREEERAGSAYSRDASARELDTEVPDPGATPSERGRRIFRVVERSYLAVAGSAELKRLAARFQAIGDIHHHHARGDVSVSVHYIDHERHDDVGVAPFEILPEALEEARLTTGTSRADANALRVLRRELRDGVMAAYRKLEPRVRDAIRERADLGHVAVQVTMDLRPGR
jgi:hypothetical protein